ncbi:ABC transporter permease subunit [Leucobacter viscericola]|uniref:ABC transporter permease subunit n=1 Tax=Leucobacter viscericola TaxID=2714935 RepID=A0A6G7XC28_9MICO|nr:ABC transporter permease subunit [Leucobacter viscericola]QIK62160.1 ABC transporter permease subunit [Leucobacter viscericola]
MTSTIVIDASSAPTTGQTSRAANPHRSNEPRPKLTFGGVVRSERLKLTSLRGVRLTILISILAGLGLSTLIAAQWTGNTDVSSASGDAALQNYLLMVSTAAASFLALVFGVLGVFAVSSEYSSGMILSTLTAVPKRMRVAAAKSIVLGIIATVTALIVVAAGLLVAVAFAPDALGQLGSSVVISGALGTVAYLVLFALFAMGVAGLLRSAAGAIAVVTGVAFVLPVAFQMMSMTGWEWVVNAMNYLPVMLGNTLSQGVVEATSGPGYWGALVSMVIMAAVTLVPAAAIFARRDAR